MGVVNVLWVWFTLRDTDIANGQTVMYCRKASQEKTLRIESPLSEKHLWTTATLKSSSFTVTGPPQVSVLFNLILPCRPFQAANFSLRLVPLPAVSVHSLVNRPSPAMKRKKCFFYFYYYIARAGRTASRDVTSASRSYVTDVTDRHYEINSCTLLYISRHQISVFGPRQRCMIVQKVD